MKNHIIREEQEQEKYRNFLRNLKIYLRISLRNQAYNNSIKKLRRLIIVKKINKTYIPYLILAGCAVFFCWWFVGRHGIFGAKVDWFSQHSVLPDYFRQQFYATGKIFPEFAMNLGGGQNVYHFAYYGLYSPVILPSYLLPFVKMEDYIMAVSVTGLVISVMLFYRWIESCKIKKEICFMVSLMFLMAGPVIGQYSGQIMFVDYMPFLCLALMGVDRYFEKEKSGLFVLSVFLMIMTSFYFSIGGMLALVLYGMHRYFQKKEGDKIRWQTFLEDGMAFGCRMLLAVLMSGCFLVPTALALTGRKNQGHSISLGSLFMPEVQVERFVYSIYGIGLTTLVVTILLTGLLYKKLYEKVLTYGCVIVFVLPVFAYLLNGGLYIRDKVFIPFLPLLCYLTAIYLEKCRNGELTLAAGGIPYLITTGFVYAERNRFTKEWIWRALLTECIVFMLCFILYYLLHVYKKSVNAWMFLILPSVVCLAVTMNLYYENKPKRYVSEHMYEKVTRKENEQAVKEVLNGDSGYYRMEQVGNEDENAADLNRIWNIGQNITSIYSSAYNLEYQMFRQKTFGIEEPFRNTLMQSVSKNLVFSRLMGVRYIISDFNVPGYTFVKKCGKNEIYRNKDAAPIMYATDKVMPEAEYKKLAYPYNQTSLLEYAVVGENTGSADQNKMTGYEPVTLKAVGKDEEKNRAWLEKTEDGWKVHAKKNRKTIFSISQITKQQNGEDGTTVRPGSVQTETQKDQVLFLRFRVDNQHPDKDVEVMVNGIRNKLSARNHIYYNGNKTFTYAVPLKNGADRIFITFGKGKYKLTQVQAYIGSLPERSKELYQPELQIDKKKTGDNHIQGTIRVKNRGWFITSIPYDKHFEIYIDGKRMKIQKVNTAFLGCKIEKGKHEVKLIYHAPGLPAGKILSLIGIAGFLFLTAGEKRK